MNSFADDTSTVNGEREGAIETGGDFVSCLGDFGLDVHVGCEEDPTSKSVCVFVPYCEEERVSQNQEPLQLPNGKLIPCVDKTVYLGHTTSGTLLDADHVSVRMSKGAQVFGALGPCLLRCNYVWTDVKRIVFESMIMPTMLDGVECCVLSTAMVEEMTTVCHRLIRSALHITPFKQRKWKLTSEALLHRIGLQPLHHYIDLKILGYAGHVERMGNFRLPKIVRDGDMEGTNMQGGQRKTHLKCVVQSLRRKMIPLETWKEMAVLKDLWREKIRTILDGAGARITGTAKKVSVMWEIHPTLLIGRQVLKQFGRKWHRGKAISTDLDIDTNEQIWHVLYDDGDGEDFSAREMAGALVNPESEDEDGGTGQMEGDSDGSHGASSSESEYDLDA